MKILFSGGHFSPALAIIDELNAGDEVLVVGRRFSLEGDQAESLEYLICKKLRIAFVELKTGRLQRKIGKHTISSLLKLPAGFYQSLSIIKKFNPDVVMVFGGYIALPIAVAARILGKPIFVHEQTTGASMANKIISKFATKVFISFKSSRKYFPESKTTLTGNPIRKEIFKKSIKIEIPPSEQVIVIMGGSTGSHFVNRIVERNLRMIFQSFPKAIVIHQTGDSKQFDDYTGLIRLQDSLDYITKKRYIVRKFIMPDEIGDILQKSSLIISRAGANSIYEYIALGKVAMLIPLSHGQRDEQLLNARFFEQEARMGLYLEERDVSDEAFLKMVKHLLSNKKYFLKNAVHAKSLIRLDASKQIYHEVQSFYARQVAKKG